MSKYKFEICTNSVTSCIAAQEGGADRVELCANLQEGGTTPSFGMIKEARKAISIQLNVIIRPRGGDFLYSKSEISQMLHDIEIARGIGVDGLVFGCLTKEGEIDKKNMKKLMHAAGDTPVTFHRAFDHCCKPLKALEEIIELGCMRILTSGLKANALEGASTIAQLIKAAGNRIIIMPGSGIRENNIAEIARITGAKEFHFSAKEVQYSTMIFRNPEVSLGSEDNAYITLITAKEKVERTIKKLTQK